MHKTRERKTKGWGNTPRARFMSLFLILCLVMGSVVSAPSSRADSRAGDGSTWKAESSGCWLEVSQTSAWEDGYTAEITVRNTGEEELRNWSVAAELQEGDIENAWNAGVKKIGRQEVVFESEKHNMVIPSGEKAVFGFKVTGGSFADLLSLKLVPGKILNTSRADITFKETGNWDGHKIMEGTITNRSGKAIRDWSLSFEMEGKIANIWNARVTEECGGTFYLQNSGYNGVLEAGESAVFGFEVTCDTKSFSGIHNVRIFAGAEGTAGEEQKTPEPPEATRTATVAPATEAPEETASPEPAETPSVTGGPEEEVSEDDIQFIQVENRDWNMDMIHANDPAVQRAKKKAGRKIRVTMLDSGINYSSEVEVVQRRNFVEGQDEINPLFEDFSGHGTAIAEILASDPESAYDDDGEDEYGTYTYYSEPDDDDEDDGENDDREAIDAGKAGKVSMLDLLESGYEWTEGLNPGIELFSGRVLDENNETTVDRLVEGIEWAVENETDILSLSLGMDKDSEKLHRAVKKAAGSGMLIIAATGEDGKTDYPAAYPEVMAVGMVDSMGESTGPHPEVSAPGDSVVSRGVFDSMQLFSGSSMAVPHVTGLASILWQQDATKDAAFIRGLIDVSANQRPETGGGYGLIDCRCALESYEEFDRQVREEPGLLERIDRNRSPEKVMEEVGGAIGNDREIETEEEMEKLHGRWKSDLHRAFVSKKYEKAWTNGRKYVRVLQSGLSFVDKGGSQCSGMRDHPWFHGFYGGVKDKKTGERTPRSNYMTSFRTLMELADHMRRRGEIQDIRTESSDPIVQNTLKGIQKAFRNKDEVGGQEWEKLSEDCAEKGGAVPKECRSLLIYGMALHTLGDTFAHSSFGLEKTVPKKGEKKTSGGKDKAVKGKVKWQRYAHYTDERKDKWYADDTESRKLRYESAQEATREAIAKIDVEAGKGLAGYENYGSPAEAFCPAKKYKELKEKFAPVKDDKGKKYKIPKISYLKEGYVLGDFADSYKKETKITDRTSKKLEKYLGYVDLGLVSEKMGSYELIELRVDKKMWVDQNSDIRVKTGGETIFSFSPGEESLHLLLPRNLDYQIENKNPLRTNTICTIEEGKIYDEIGREMRERVPGAAGEEDGDEEEEIGLCALAEYEMSTDCLVKGKVVRFDYKEGWISTGDMPGMKGAEVTLQSRKDHKVYQTKTKEDGSYRIQVPAGQYDATYKKGEKYIAVKQLVNISEAWDYIRNMTIELAAVEWKGSGEQYGRLCDSQTGEPLSGVTVRIYKGIGYFDTAPVKSVETDENGYYNTGLLGSGAYSFRIQKEGYRTVQFWNNILGGREHEMSEIALHKEG